MCTPISISSVSALAPDWAPIFGWMNLTPRWYFIAGSLLLVLVGGIAGTYIGLVYGEYVEPSYMGRQYTIDNSLHFGAGIGGIIVSTALGLLHGIRALGR